MSAVRWIALVLFALSFTTGCQQRPDTDPTVDELQVPAIDGGGAEDSKSETP